MNIPELKQQFDAEILEAYNQLPITARERAQRHLLNKIRFLGETDYSALVRQIIGAAWLAFKENYPDLLYPGSVFLSEVNIVAVSMYFIDALKYAWRFGEVALGDMRLVKRFASLILNPDIVPPEYWGMLNDWPDTIYYHDLIRKDLQQMSLNHRYGKSWFINLPSSKSRLLKTI